MPLYLLFIMMAVISHPRLYAVSSVSTTMQAHLKNLQKRQGLLEESLHIIQQKELVVLDDYLREACKQLEKSYKKKNVALNDEFVEKAQAYITIVQLSKTPPTGFYYDVSFWMRYVPLLLAQEEVQKINPVTMQFPLPSGQDAAVKNFTSLFYEYTSFFEQWPVTLQKDALYYAKAQDAYNNFSVTQTFVTSLLAQQQSVQTTEDQLKNFIPPFRQALYNHGTVTLAQKAQYGHALDMYATQGKTTVSQKYKQFQLWSFIAALLYYQEQAGLPQPKDLTNAGLFETTYTEFSSFLDGFDKKWMYYADGQSALSGLMSYYAACKTLLEQPKNIPAQPKPTPAPATPSGPAAPAKSTMTGKVDTFIETYFSDAVLEKTTSADLVDALMKYKNLMEDYKNSTEHEQTKYSQYQLWADFVPVRYAQLRVIALTGVKDKRKGATVIQFNTALNAFRKTPSYAQLHMAYPSLYQELELCSYYGNWLAQQR